MTGRYQVSSANSATADPGDTGGEAFASHGRGDAGWSAGSWWPVRREIAAPEFLLALACTVRPVPVERVRRASQAVGDWGLCLRVAKRHGIVGLVVDAMRVADVRVPEPLERAARRRGRAALRQAGEALRLQELLAKAGISALSLKGTSLARHLYGALGIRDSVDIDLAVAPDMVARAWDVLAAAGYVVEIPERRLSGAALRMFLLVAKDSFHRHPAGAIVELHWRLSDDLAEPVLPPPETWRRVEVAPNRTLAMLGDEALFVYLCVHGAAHGWARLKWLADIGAMLASSADGGNAYWRAARCVCADVAAASGLILAHRFLGAKLPSNFATPRSPRSRLLVKLAVGTMTAGGGARDLSTTGYRGWVEFTAKLLVAPTARSVAVTLRRLAISGEDVGRLPLPKGCGWLYPVLRIPMLAHRRIRRSAVRRERRDLTASRTP